jgi:RNA polymerase sigma factor (sigma-70 family)
MDPESLLVRARAGDEQAWNDLLTWCRPLVRGQFRRVLPACPDEASDLTNVTQCNMHQGFPAFRGEALGQFLAWVRVITRNVWIDYIRYHRGHPPTTVGFPVEPLSSQPEPWEQLVRDEDLVRLESALEKLPEPHRTVIEARLFDRLAPCVIAKRLGWSQERVRVCSWRAVKILASELRGKS